MQEFYLLPLLYLPSFYVQLWRKSWKKISTLPSKSRWYIDAANTKVPLIQKKVLLHITTTTLMSFWRWFPSHRESISRQQEAIGVMSAIRCSIFRERASAAVTDEEASLLGRRVSSDIHSKGKKSFVLLGDIFSTRRETNLNRNVII